VLDTLEYTDWTDSIITIENFSWIVKPSYYNQYLLRGDRVFLSLLKANKFQKELYFTLGFMEDQRLSLKEYLSPLVVADKLSISDEKLQTFEDYKKHISEILKLSKYLNLNTPDELRIFDNSRLLILIKIQDYLTDNEKEKAKELMSLLDELANDKKYPYLEKSWKEYADYIREQLLIK